MEERNKVRDVLNKSYGLDTVQAKDDLQKMQDVLRQRLVELEQNDLNPSEAHYFLSKEMMKSVERIELGQRSVNRDNKNPESAGNLSSQQKSVNQIGANYEGITNMEDMFQSGVESNPVSMTNLEDQRKVASKKRNFSKPSINAKLRAQAMARNLGQGSRPSLY